MRSIKLSITCRAALAAKYTPAALSRIDAAVVKWVAADQARGITTLHVELDDPKEMKKHGVPPVKGKVTPGKVKQALDALADKLLPDYIVLFGSSDVVPSFEVVNPSAKEDEEDRVPTDNPYASSREFVAGRRSSYLIPDRVVGRIPDLPGSSDPDWLLAYLREATRVQPRPKSAYAKDMLVCAASWKKAGLACVKYLGRSAQQLAISPPTTTQSAAIKARLGAALHMIKCHGAELESEFFGQHGNAFPAVISSKILQGRVKAKSVVGAMCCYGASVFDPNDPAREGDVPPIPSVYLRGGAYGFVGATNTAWVGQDAMMDADWIVSSFFKAVLGGASLGRALLESKQDFVNWTHQQGASLDAPDEKTLLQFVLLGDPSIHPVGAPATPASAGPVAASMAGGSSVARSARRSARRELGALLGAALPRVVKVPSSRIPSAIKRLGQELAKSGRSKRRVVARAERKVHPVAVLAAVGPVAAKKAKKAQSKRVTVQYYFAAKAKHAKNGKNAMRAIKRDIRLVSVEVDAQQAVVRSKVIVSS